MYNFGPASHFESIVYGAEKPGYSMIGEWIEFMKTNDIERICCLLPESQLADYPAGLLHAYRNSFGEDNVCHAPVEDFHLAPLDLLTKVILPFLAESDRDQQKVVVHCSGGSGRTGHVLAAWLVHARGMLPEAALDAVCVAGEARRNPKEAIWMGNATKPELLLLLENCR